MRFGKAVRICRLADNHWIGPASLLPTPLLRGPAWPPSAQRPHPVGDGPPDVVRRIFLNEMDPRHCLLGQRWPPADEVDQRIIGEDRTWLSLQEQLGHIARP